MTARLRQYNPLCENAIARGHLGSVVHNNKMPVCSHAVQPMYLHDHEKHELRHSGQHEQSDGTLDMTVNQRVQHADHRSEPNATT